MTDKELCQEVSEKVMGIASTWHEWLPRRKWPIESNWEDAGRVVEKMRKKGFHYCVSDTYSVNEPHSASFWKEKTMLPREWVSADTMPRAVFQAALKAVGASA